MASPTEKDGYFGISLPNVNSSSILLRQLLAKPSISTHPRRAVSPPPTSARRASPFHPVWDSSQASDRDILERTVRAPDVLFSLEGMLMYFTDGLKRR